MEEIRQTIAQLQENIKTLAIADEAIKDVIKQNTKNLETLKNYNLEINDRFKALDKTFALGDIIVNEVARVRENMQNLMKRQIPLKKKQLKINYSQICG